LGLDRASGKKDDKTFLLLLSANMAYKLFVDFVQRLLTDLATAKPEFVAGLQEIQAILEDDSAFALTLIWFCNPNE
jgi:hypothetical protein